MHYVLARLTVKPEAAEQASGILTEMVAHSRQEAGCLSYELYQRIDAPHVFQTVENWKSEADARAHLDTPHVATAVKTAGALFAMPPEVVAWNKLV